MEREKINEIDFTRGFAIFAVVIIHLTSSYAGYPVGSYTYLIFGGINRAMSFAVPIFLFISALLLTYNTKEKGILKLREFYIKRLSKVLIPYFVWTAIYLIYLKLTNNFVINPLIQSWEFIKEYLILGKACYHLYFIPIIVQFYLVFPLIWFLIKPRVEVKVDKYTGFYMCLFFSAVFQYLFLKFNSLYIYPVFQNSAVILFSYILPVSMGVWMGYNWKEFKSFDFLTKTSFVGFAFATGYYYVRRELFGWGYPIWVMHMLYSTFAGIAIIFIVSRIKSCKILSELSKYSFPIYFVHPLVMFFLESTFNRKLLEISESAFVNYSVDFLLRFSIVIVISYLASRFIEFVKLKIKSFK